MLLACISGAACTKLNDYYSQCIPGAATTAPATTAVPTLKPSTAPPNTAAPSTTVPATPPPAATGFVTVDGTKFKLNGNTYTVAG